MEAHDICDSLAHETEGVRACVVLDLDTGFTLLSSRRAVVDAAEVRRMVRTACLVCQNKLLGRYAAALNAVSEAAERWARGERAGAPTVETPDEIVRVNEAVHRLSRTVAGTPEWPRSR